MWAHSRSTHSQALPECLDASQLLEGATAAPVGLLLLAMEELPEGTLEDWLDQQDHPSIHNLQALSGVYLSPNIHTGYRIVDLRQVALLALTVSSACAVRVCQCVRLTMSS